MLRIEAEAESNLHKLEQEGQLNDRKIVLFGISDYTEILYRLLEKHGYKPFIVIDNNITRHNTKMEKVNIWHTSYFFERYDDAYIFLMMSGYYEEMKNQLEHEGYLENIHIFEMAKVDKSDSWHAINDTRLELHMADVVELSLIHI